ncbi:hypothetical protein SPURM210S_03681 [Streptomyces purpurascens]
MRVVADPGQQSRTGPEPGGRDRLVRALAARVDGQIGAEHGLAGTGPALDTDHEVGVGRPDDQEVVVVHELSPH